MRAFVFGTEVDALDGPEDVTGGEDDTAGGDDREERAVVPRAEDDEDFADEAAQAGEAEAGEEQADGEAAVERHCLHQAAELVEIAMANAVVDHADHKEHAGR